jgi:hypothetical protein
LVDDKEYTFETPYQEDQGKRHPSYVPGEFGYKNLVPTFPFPGVEPNVIPGTTPPSAPATVVRNSGDIFKRTILSDANKYTLSFDPSTKTATISGQVPYYTTTDYDFLAANGNWIALGIKFPTILGADANYDLQSITIGSAAAIEPPVLTSAEKTAQEVYVLLPVASGDVGNSTTVVINWKTSIEVETFTIEFASDLTLGTSA